MLVGYNDGRKFVKDNQFLYTNKGGNLYDRTYSCAMS